MVCAQLARGEKEGQVIRSLCSTLQNTGSSPEIVATTMMASLRRVLEKQECDIMKDIGRTMHEQGTESKKIYLFVYVLILSNIYMSEGNKYEYQGKAVKNLKMEVAIFVHGPL